MRKLICRVLLVVLLICGAEAAKADTCNGFSNNLVSNCGFESGSFASWSGSATQAGSDYAGIDNGDPFTTFKTPYEGTYEAYLGYPGSTVTLTQTLATVAGTVYNVQFALLNDTDPTKGYSNSLSVLFGSTSIFSETAASAGNYMLYSFTALANSSSTDLSFSAENDGGFFDLDSISVVPTASAATPEPSSLFLLGTGMLGVLEAARRRLREQ